MNKNENRQYRNLIDRQRLEHELTRRTHAIEVLWEMSRDDPTIHAFLTAWRSGSFPSFEEMLCRLAMQLATEKAEYLKIATKAVESSSLQPIALEHPA